MKIEANIETILEMMDRPAFCVSGGIVREANRAALGRMVEPGAAIASLIVSGRSEFQAFSSGCLYLTLDIGGKKCGATVSRLGDAAIFSLDPEEEPELRAFALAAQELRRPLSQVLSISDQLFPELAEGESESTTEQLSRINRGLHRMLRLVGNMADAGSSGNARMELRDVTAVLQEIFEQIQPYCQHAGIRFSFTNHPASVCSLVDSEQLERAVLNLLSNALKYTAPGGEITAQLTRRGNTLYLTITDSGNGKAQSLSAGMLSRFHREPGFSDGRSGLGLGLTLVRAAAAAHQGTLLLEQTKSGGVRTTLSLPIIQKTDTLRSPAIRIDYAGERDHSLIELSDSLPPELFTPKKN